jgi:hypothetical protein
VGGGQIGGDRGEAVVQREGRGIVQRRHQRGGQKLCRFHQPHGGAVQVGRSVAKAGERAFHGRPQIVIGIGDT